MFHKFPRFSSCLALMGMALTAGCLDPQSFETAPVSLQTDRGVVVCQLYTKDRVLWDRAVDRPDGMSVREADDICRAYGKSQKKQL